MIETTHLSLSSQQIILFVALYAAGIETFIELGRRVVRRHRRNR